VFPDLHRDAETEVLPRRSGRPSGGYVVFDQAFIEQGANAETCGVLALKVWLETAGISEGPIFRSIRRGGCIKGRLSDKAVALIVKRYTAAAGLDPASFSGHSLRAGLVTSAARAGVAERVIMRQTGHKNIDMVLRYVRQANAFRDNAVNALGL
jgi:integrase